jgi:pRiA4b ORF-3-like protein
MTRPPALESRTNWGRRPARGHPSAARGWRHARHHAARTPPERVPTPGGGARGQSADLAAAADPRRHDGRRSARGGADRVRLDGHPPASVRRPGYVQGREYGIGYVGGGGFRDDPHLVRLADLGLRPTERFVYDYDVTDSWRLDMRLEQILVMDPDRFYPRCTGGRAPARQRAAAGYRPPRKHPTPSRPGRHPPCGRDPGILHDEDVPRFGEHRDKLAGLLPLLGVDRFDRRRLNRALAAHAATGTRAA